VVRRFLVLTLVATLGVAAACGDSSGDAGPGAADDAGPAADLDAGRGADVWPGPAGATRVAQVGGVSELAVTATRLYVVVSTGFGWELDGLSKAGGTPHQVAAEPISEASFGALVVGADGVYLAGSEFADSILYRASLTDDAMADTQRLAPGLAVQAIATVGESLYLLGSNGDNGALSIWRQDVWGETATTVYEHPSLSGPLSVDESWIFFTIAAGPDTPAALVRVGRDPAPDEQPVTLMTFTAENPALTWTMDASSLYLVDPARTLWQIDKVSGAAVALVADTQLQYFAQAMDDASIYLLGSVANQLDRWLLRVAKTSGTVDVLVSDPQLGNGIAVDDTSVYFGASPPDGSDEAIWRIDRGAPPLQLACIPEPQPANAMPTCLSAPPASADCDTGGGAGCFMLPSREMTVLVNGHEEAPSMNCAGGLGVVSVQIRDVTLRGTVRDFATQRPVGGATAEVYTGQALPTATATASASGGYSVLLPANDRFDGSGPFATRAQGALDTQFVSAHIVDVGQAETDGWDLPSLSTATAQGWSTAVGQSFGSCDSVLMLRLVDCNGRPIRHAVVTASLQPYGTPQCPTFVEGSRVYYLGEDSATLQPRSVATETGASGTAVLLKTNLITRVVAYGFKEATDVAQGYAGLAAVANTPLVGAPGTATLWEMQPNLP
jgi:hypothetical protein